MPVGVTDCLFSACAEVVGLSSRQLAGDCPVSLSFANLCFKSFLTLSELDLNVKFCLKYFIKKPVWYIIYEL